MNTIEISTIVGTLVALAMCLFAYFRYGFDRASKRQAHYRLAKELLADLQTQTSMNPIQMRFGYEAIGGPSGRPADEIRHVLQLAECHPNLVNLHGRAALHHVGFSVPLRRFQWIGPLASRPVRIAAQFACVAWYFLALTLGVYAFQWLVGTGSSPASLEFWFVVFMLVTWFGFTGVGTLMYSFRIYAAAELIQMPESDVPKTMNPTAKWRALKRTKASTLPVGKNAR
jgi:hypothetical protein